MLPLPASRARARAGPLDPAAGGGFHGLREASGKVGGGSQVWLRAAPGDRAECHLSLLSGIRSVSGPPAALHFLQLTPAASCISCARSRVTFSSLRGSGLASSSGQKDTHSPI